MTQPVLREDLGSPPPFDLAGPTPELGVVHQALTCVLLGEEPLAARCGELLLERGHAIIGCVATSPVIRQWAKSHGIPTFERNAYRPWLESQAFDLLLSVTHPNLIDPAHIGRARVAALNY